MVEAKREALMSALAAQTLEVARLTAEQGDVERARLALVEAAQLYDEAAELAAPHDPDAALTYRSQAADAWYQQGRDKGDSTALETSIARWQSVAAKRDRKREPLDWAAAQNSLGSALTTLGSWQRGTERLEQAVATFRAALQETPRELAPLDWARTRNNLARTLLDLGQRARSAEDLRAALDAFKLSRDLFGTTEEPYADYFASMIAKTEAALGSIE